MANADTLAAAEPSHKGVPLTGAEVTETNSAVVAPLPSSNGKYALSPGSLPTRGLSRLLIISAAVRATFQIRNSSIVPRRAPA